MKSKIFFSILALLMSCSSDDFLNSDKPEKDIDNNASVKMATFELSEKESIDLAQKVIASLNSSEAKTKAYSNPITFSLQKNEYNISDLKDTYRITSTKSVLAKSNISELDSVSIKTFDIAENDKKGFVMMLADKRFPRLLAYVPNGSLKDTIYNEALKYQIVVLKNTVNERREQFYADNNIEQIEDIRAGELIISPYYEEYGFVPPILKTEWHQSAPYNNTSPLITCSGQQRRAYAGCVPVAMAQIVTALKKPTGYNYSLLEQSSTITTDPVDASRATEVSRLIRDIQIKVGIRSEQYECNGTGADENQIKTGFSKLGFGNYKRTDMKPDYGNNNTHCSQDVLRSELKAKRPVFIAGWSKITGGGHAWVIDGYREFSGIQITRSSNNDMSPMVGGITFLVHINWGWGPSGDPWDRSGNGYFDNTCHYFESTTPELEPWPYTENLFLIYNLVQ